MHVLFYVYPAMMSQGPRFTLAHAAILAQIMSGLIAAGRAECRMIAGQRYAEHLPPSLIAPANLSVIDEIELHRAAGATGGHSAVPTELCRQARSARAAHSPAIEVLIDRIAGAAPRFGEFEPDVVITFSMQADYLKQLWPDAVVLHVEAAAFSRPPFPFSLFFDHLGTYERAATALLAEKDVSVSDGAIAFARSVRDGAGATLAAVDPFADMDLRAGFARLVLLPLNVSNFFSFDDYAPYRTQLKFLFDVLLAAPPEVGVVVTERVEWGRVLHDSGSAANLDWLRSRFANLVFYDRFRDYASPSPYLLRHVDGIVAVILNVGLQGLLLDRRLGCNETSPLRKVAHETNLKAFFQGVEQGTPPADRIRWLAWYLESYAIPASIFNDGDAFSSYLERKLDALRTGSNLADTFPAIAPLHVLEGHWQGWEGRNEVASWTTPVA